MNSTIGVGVGRNKAVLSVVNLSVSFPSESGVVRAVRDLSYDVRGGEVLGIVGESGSGKSVSSLALMGLLPESATVTGEVRFDGRNLLSLNDNEMSAIRGREIAMVFQDPLSALTPVFTVGDQISEAVLTHQKVSKRAAWARSVELLELVGLPRAGERAKSFPHEFSGGMRQRVMIAMAMANEPSVIIADEPTTALDVTVQAQVLDVLRTARDVTGAAVVFITHDLGVVAGIADRTMIMYAGQAVEYGDTLDVFGEPKAPYTVGLLGSIPRLDQRARTRLTPIIGSPPQLNQLGTGCAFAPRCPLVTDICLAAEPLLAAATNRVGSHGDHLVRCYHADEVGQSTTAQFLRLAGVDDSAAALSDPSSSDVVVVRDRAGQTVLQVDDLVRHYQAQTGSIIRRTVGRVHAVDGVSFDVHAGETLAIVGESGCGKSTLLMEIMDLGASHSSKRDRALRSGTVSLDGADVSSYSSSQRQAARRQLQIVFQDPMASLDPRLTIADILAEPLEAHGINGAAASERVRELMGQVGLSVDQLARFPGEFSGGQRQRIGIARALALRPSLLVLDEPVSALDVSVRAGVLNLLNDLQTSTDVAFVVVSHDLSVVRHIASRVAVMHVGRIVELGDVDAVFSRPMHPYTEALLSAIPIPDPIVERQRTRIVLMGDPASPINPPPGCRFSDRCALRVSLSTSQQHQCVASDPALVGGDRAHGDHQVACHHRSTATRTAPMTAPVSLS
jgi:peptide/nickel transport system ATP-binding protein